MNKNSKNLTYFNMKQLEEMSMEELVKETNYLTKRIEVEEAVRKEERIAELEKQVKLLNDI